MESTDSSTNPPHPNLPPGFRFYPTDEELVVHYLKRKAASAPLPVSVITDIDLYKFDPWELPAKASFGEQEWYFFSPRDRKYPNGARPNRAATSGYWKATGTDKPVLSSGGTQKVGVKKALVFYGGKPPKGIKTNWIMHEYRLADNKTSKYKPAGSDLGNKKNSLRLDDWVLCRIYKKANSNRPSMDPDRDDSIDDMMGGIPPSINVGQLNGRLQFPKMSTSYARALLENEHHNSIDGIVISGINTSSVITTSPLSDSKSREQLDIVPTNSLPQKRTFDSLCWNDHHDQDMAAGGGASITNRKLSMDNGDGSVLSTEENRTLSSIASLLTQLPQTPTLHQQTMFASVGDGLFRQPYQLHGMNCGRCE